MTLNLNNTILLLDQIPFTYVIRPSPLKVLKWYVKLVYLAYHSYRFYTGKGVGNAKNTQSRRRVHRLCDNLATSRTIKELMYWYCDRKDDVVLATRILGWWWYIVETLPTICRLFDLHRWSNQHSLAYRINKVLHLPSVSY